MLSGDLGGRTKYSLAEHGLQRGDLVADAAIQTVRLLLTQLVMPRVAVYWKHRDTHTHILSYNTCNIHMVTCLQDTRV